MMALRACHTAAMMLRAPICGKKTQIEPYEAGWAWEAVAFICIHEAAGESARLYVELETSPDGLRWTTLVPAQELSTPGVHRIRAEGFGNWLRATLFATGEICVDFYWVLK